MGKRITNVLPIIVLSSILFNIAASSPNTTTACDSTIPVIFIHKKNASYLEDSLWQARQYNSRVILIGDQTNNHYPEIEHYDMHDYFDQAESFAKVYKHIGGMPFGFELFCFQRWFILKAFMEAHNIERCFYCDSDVMLYCNVTEENKLFSEYDMALINPPHGILSGESSFMSISSLQDFCIYVYQTYQDEKVIAEWLAWFNDPARPPKHSICDMRLFTRYASTGRSKIGNLRTIINDAAFDHHMGVDEGGCFALQKVERDGKIIALKEIKWIHNRPYAYHKKLNTFIRFKSLHFQGPRKPFMSQYRMPSNNN